MNPKRRPMEASMRDWMKALIDQTSAWPGVSIHEHRFGGVEFRVGEREIGHLHSFGIVDIPFTVKIRDALIGAGKAKQHRWLPESGWTTVEVKNNRAENARTLLRFSYLRVQAKSPDAVLAEEAQSELLSFPIEPEVLAAAGVTAPAARV
jgi:hypothetical protein